MSLLDRPYRRLANTLVSMADKLLGHERVWARPLRIHLEINDFCNLKCPHCPRENPLIPKNTGHIPIDAVRKLVPWFREASYVGLAGNGEPFLHPEILEILELITKAGAAPSVISNATLWKRYGLVERLAGIGPMLLNVSIDGGTRETFEKWRKGANFDEVRENLLLLRANKEKKGTPFPIVNFITCLMKDNIGEVENIVDLAGEAGVSVITFQNMFPYNKLMEHARVRDMDTCREAIAKANARALKHNIRIDWLPMSVDVDERGTEGGSYGFVTAEDVEGKLRERGAVLAEPADAALAVASAKAHPNGNGNVRKHRYHCDAIMHQIHVTVTGDIKFCCFWTEGPVGNLLKDDFGQLWNSPAWRQLRRDLKEGRKRGPCEGCHNLVDYDAKKIVRAGMLELRDLWRR